MEPSAAIPVITALLGVLFGGYLAGRRDRVNAIIQLNLADSAETKAICRDAFGLLLRAEGSLKGFVNDGIAMDADLRVRIVDLQARAEFHLPPLLSGKLREAFDVMSPPTRAWLSGKHEEALRVINGGAIKAARVEFMTGVQVEFDRLHLELWQIRVDGTGSPGRWYRWFRGPGTGQESLIMISGQLSG